MSLTLNEVQDLISRKKSLVSDMVWSHKRAKMDFQWLTCRMAIQFDDEAAMREQFYVEAQWRKKCKDIPEHWTFNLLFQTYRIYALHVQPTTSHTNSVGKGLKFYNEVIGGIHQHIWVSDGDGYAEPISVQLDRPDIMWLMFLRRANINPIDFSHPDQNEPELDI